jgi:hypothetical protein
MQMFVAREISRPRSTIENNIIVAGVETGVFRRWEQHIIHGHQFCRGILANRFLRRRLKGVTGSNGIEGLPV